MAVVKSCLFESTHLQLQKVEGNLEMKKNRQNFFI